jgi:hypothetical protein
MAEPGARKPGVAALGAWSGGRFLHFGEAITPERLVDLLQPDERLHTVLTPRPGAAHQLYFAVTLCGHLEPLNVGVLNERQHVRTPHEHFIDSRHSQLEPRPRT